MAKGHGLRAHLNLVPNVPFALRPSARKPHAPLCPEPRAPQPPSPTPSRMSARVAPCFLLRDFLIKLIPNPKGEFLERSDITVGLAHALCPRLVGGRGVGGEFQ